MIALAEGGTGWQKEWAAFALGSLAVENKQNQDAIGHRGIAVLTALMASDCSAAAGVEDTGTWIRLKEKAAFALQMLDCGKEDLIKAEGLGLLLLDWQTLVRQWVLLRRSEKGERSAARSAANAAMNEGEASHEAARSGFIPAACALSPQSSHAPGPQSPYPPQGQQIPPPSLPPAGPPPLLPANPPFLPSSCPLALEEVAQQQPAETAQAGTCTTEKGERPAGVVKRCARCDGPYGGFGDTCAACRRGRSVRL